MNDYELHQEYKEYNKVVVTINPGESNQYVLSNVNTKGKPSAACESHLQSLSIEPPAYDSGHPANVGAKGSITIVDYRDAVVNILINHFINYMSKVGVCPEGAPLASIDPSKIKPEDIDYSKLLPTVRIEISCYIGSTVVYDGHILDWSTQFVGTTPSVSLNWSVICPSNPAPSSDSSTNVSISDPKKYYEYVKSQYSTTKGPDEIIFQYADGRTLKGGSAFSKIKAPTSNGGSGELPEPQAFTRNQIINALNYICQTCVCLGDDGIQRPIIGRLSNDGKIFYFIEKNPEIYNPDNDDNVVSKNIMFIQNGKFPPYSIFKKDKVEYRVIPMTSFSFSTSFKQLALQFNITENLNGNKMTTGDGTSTETGAKTANAQMQSAAKDAGASAISVKFDCYNIMSFNQYNLNSMISYEVYNEFGDRHISSGKATVTKVTYDLSGAVIKASVEATQMFNTVVGDTLNIGDNQDIPSTPSGIDKSGSVILSPLPSTEDPNYDLIMALREEDEEPLPLSLDKTETVVDDPSFEQQVTEFLNKYAVEGPKGGGQRMIGLSYIHKLMQSGNFGLLTLLLAVCNYGIKKDTDSEDLLDYEDWFNDCDDIALKYDGFKGRKKWFASDIGKNPYDYKAGGLGIAHWDAENLQEIYETCGFNPNTSDSAKSELEKLFLDIPTDTKEAVKYSTGKFLGWSSPTKRHITPSRYVERIIPQFKGNCYMRRFDNGLKQSDAWKQWAREILYYRGEDDQNRPYQAFLFKMWIEKYWIPTINALKNVTSPSNGHIVCLQDAVRIARAGNSKTSFISKMAGKSVVEQYSIYYGNDDRYVRQKAFCKRLADILTWRFGDEYGIKSDSPKSEDSGYSDNNGNNENTLNPIKPDTLPSTQPLPDGFSFNNQWSINEVRKSRGGVDFYIFKGVYTVNENNGTYNIDIPASGNYSAATITCSIRNVDGQPTNQLLGTITYIENGSNKQHNICLIVSTKNVKSIEGRVLTDDDYNQFLGKLSAYKYES